MLNIYLTRVKQLFVLSLVLAFVQAIPLDASTIIPPKNLAELGKWSDAVVLAETVDGKPERRGSLIFTNSQFLVIESLRGIYEPGDQIEVSTPGGTLNVKTPKEETWHVPGSPQFYLGETYLLFLKQDEDGTLKTTALSHGILREQRAKDRTEMLVSLPDSLGLDHIDGETGLPIHNHSDHLKCFYQQPLLDHLKECLNQKDSWSEKLVVVPEEESLQPELQIVQKAVPNGCSFFESGGRNFRWRTFDSGGTATIFADEIGDNSVSRGAFKLVVNALDWWHQISGTSLNLQLGGTRARSINCGNGQDSEANLILFNDPCSDIDDLNNCGGVLAFGGPRSSGSHNFDGTSWLTVTSWVVVVNNGSGCLGESNYTSMMAHELGHGLGHGHVGDSGALMYANCCRRVNDTDRTCTRYVYPASNPNNQRPTVDAGEDITVSVANQSLRLRGTADDDGGFNSLSFSWDVITGPGEVTFSSPNDIETEAQFSRSGYYLLTLTADDGQLIRTDPLEVNITINVASEGLIQFQQGLDGYTGTHDTILSESSSQNNFSNAINLVVDLDTPTNSDQETQVLLRFDNLFGSQDTQIPPGATINSAILKLTTVDTGDGASLYRLNSEWQDTDTWVSSGSGIQIATETEGGEVASVTGTDGIVEIDVTSSLQAWSQAPCENYGWVFFAADDNGWQFNSSEGNDPPLLEVSFQSQRNSVIIPNNGQWDYFKGTQAPPANWNDNDFVINGQWIPARTGIGYQDNDDRTVLDDMRNNYISIFCRHEFEVDNPSSLEGLQLSIDYDDGFVAYINGEEVARSSNMGSPGTPVAYNAEASSSHEAGTPELYSLSSQAIVQGTNVLAIEIHNQDIDSSDLSFIPELTYKPNFIDEGSIWAYRRGNIAPPANWNDFDFDILAWEEGPSGFGYGDGDDQTEFLDMQGNYRSIFVRKSFFLSQIPTTGEVQLTALYDDGIVVYLNGEEVSRASMPTGAISNSTLASQGGETKVRTFFLPKNRLRVGENILGISVHNASTDSSDLSLVPIIQITSQNAGNVNCGESFIRGDVDADGVYTIGDPVNLLFHLFRGFPAPICPDAADVDDNGAYEINDVLSILNFIFLSGPAPADPGFTCGSDPTEDDFPTCLLPSCISL